MDLQPQAFYQRLQEDDRHPTTSQAGVGDFLDAIQQAMDRGATETLILTVSSAMSGAYNMASQAAAQAEIPVTVIDSKGPSMSLGWQVLAAARARDEGAGMEEIIECVNQVRESLVQVVAMETLEYLETGGRIGEAAKWVGTVLKVKPVVMIDHKKGWLHRPAWREPKNQLWRLCLRNLKMRLVREKYFILQFCMVTPWKKRKN